MSEINNIIDLVSKPSKDSFRDRINFLKDVKGMETSIIERGYNLNPDWILEDFIALKNAELSSYTPHFYSKLAVSEER